jgi:hypothetical protein
VHWLEGAESSVAERVLGEWRVTLGRLAGRAADPQEQAAVAAARVRLAAVSGRDSEA